MAPEKYIALVIPLVYLSICAGILVIGNLLFLYLYRSTTEKLHLSTLATGLTGLLFITGEVLVLISLILNNPEMGRQFHRIQAISVTLFIAAIPYLVYTMLELNRTLRKIMRAIVMTGGITALAITAAAFIAPDLFVSQTTPAGSDLVFWLGEVRGKTGPLYILRDTFLAPIMLFVIFCMLYDIIRHRRYLYTFLPLAGLLIAILAGFFDFIKIYEPFSTSTLKGRYPGYTSFTSPGITLFIILSMSGVMKRFIDQTRDQDRTRRIEALSLFAGGIAHDFNNLLTVIIGNLSLARLTAKDPMVIDGLADAEKASMKARDLTQQLLSFSRGGVPAKSTVSIGELLVSTVHLVLSGSPVKCGFTIDPALYNVAIDRAQISQVIQNIALNAKQAMPNGGNFAVIADNESSRIWKEFPETHKKRYARISFSDTGGGISQRDLKHIFDPYFTTKKSGTGLGLTLSYSIIKKHGGYIFASSKKGTGTTFEIFLPATTRRPDKNSETSETAASSGGSVLIMDDDPLILSVAENMLRVMKYSVHTSRDGTEAVALYKSALDRSDPYRFVILDLTVPGGMGGKEAVKKIRELDPGAKIIASSGYSNDPVIVHFREHGFSGVIEKPYRYDDLAAAVASVLSE